MKFDMGPPLLFVAYRPGTFKSPRNLIFRRAIFETLQTAYATDPDGNRWSFQGRFNALCRGGAGEIGPIVWSSQLLIAEDPLTRPVLVRRACNGSGPMVGWAEYDPYAEEDAEDDCDGSSTGNGGGAGSGEQYEPGQNTGGETVDWNTGIGNGGTSSCGGLAVVEYVCVYVWNDSSQKWNLFSCGFVTTC